MTVEETKKAIAVMQAFVDGAEIEHTERGLGGSFSGGNPAWDWLRWSYQVKPEPREIWVNCYRDGQFIAHDTLEKAEHCRDPLPGATTIKFREVME